MHKGRLEAFSDGVLAIIITIMVLELHAPQHAAHFSDLKPLLPVFLTYAMSFVYVGIYWNNHHHMLQVTQHVTGAVLWANLHLLFWLSLVPFVTGWLGENAIAKAPTALYGFVLLMSGVAYTILLREILRVPGGNKTLAEAVGRDMKGKASVVFYAIAIAVSFWNPSISCLIYVFVALMWFIPDPRIERVVDKAADQ
jgi:TMEM175 potassium channel family protein